MKISRNEARRVAFANHLLRLGKREIQRANPLSTCSLLFFHDATELLLDTLLSHFNVPDKATSFKDYWKLAKTIPSVQTLPYEREFEKLNRARVSLKHHGIHPSSSDLDGFRASAENLFSHVVENIFETKLGANFLTDFIVDDEIREKLESSIESLEAADYYQVSASAALAFHLVTKNYFAKNKLHRLHNPLDFSRLGQAPHIRRDEYQTDEKAHQFLVEVKQAIEDMQETIKTITLGIDFQSFRRFHALTPEIVQFIGGKITIHDRQRGRSPELTPADAEFCIEFVTSVALDMEEKQFEPPRYLTK